MTKLLLVDDIDENRYMLKIIMQAAGYDVVEAKNGRDALDTAHRYLPEIIITDILMPEMDGFQLCREWHADAVLKETPFVFYTATYTDYQDEEFALSLGADLFIRKPQEPEVLVDQIRRVVDIQQRHPGGKNRPTDNRELTHYETVLFRKLEKKVMELEQSKAELERQISEREKTEAARQSLERQLRHAQRMEALGTLSGGIAHDFNNFLQGISGYAGMVAERINQPRLSKNDMTVVADYLDIIQNTCQRAAVLVQQMRTFSIEVEQHLISLSLGEHVTEALKLLRSSLPSGVMLREEIDESCPYILGDPTQIHQLVVNLCVNGFESMQKIGSGTLTVSVKTETISKAVSDELFHLSPGSFVVLRVADTGEGMTPEVKEHIFDPYFTTKGERGGTGLGLAVVHGITQSHKAVINVESHIREGTVFAVYFPPASAIS